MRLEPRNKKPANIIVLLEAKAKLFTTHADLYLLFYNGFLDSSTESLEAASSSWGPRVFPFYLMYLMTRDTTQRSGAIRWNGGCNTFEVFFSFVLAKIL